MSNVPAPSRSEVSASLRRLELDVLEEIEACAQVVLRQAGHLNRLLSLRPGPVSEAAAPRSLRSMHDGGRPLSGTGREESAR